jgi:hypothetical protein
LDIEKESRLVRGTFSKRQRSMRQPIEFISQKDLQTRNAISGKLSTIHKIKTGRKNNDRETVNVLESSNAMLANMGGNREVAEKKISKWWDFGC